MRKKLIFKRKLKTKGRKYAYRKFHAEISPKLSEELKPLLFAKLKEEEAEMET